MTLVDGPPAWSRTPDTAHRLRELGPLGVLAFLVIVAGSLAGPVAGAFLVLVWAQLSDTPLRALGFAAPRSWPATAAAGAALGIGLKLVLKALVMPMLGAPAVNVRYQYLAGNAAALPWMLTVVLVSAAFGEEVLFRGYLFERSGKLLGHAGAALVATVVLTAALFAVAHYGDQGLPGVEQAAMTGLVFGGIFAWQRQIWIVMIAHAAFDITAIALIYNGWERPVAHLLFH
ncbi:MAG: lysostaphin resistance A-like protein [Betaproteobacteria bacterium]